MAAPFKIHRTLRPFYHKPTTARVTKTGHTHTPQKKSPLSGHSFFGGIYRRFAANCGKSEPVQICTRPLFHICDKTPTSITRGSITPLFKKHESPAFIALSGIALQELSIFCTKNDMILQIFSMIKEKEEPTRHPAKGLVGSSLLR